MVMEPKVAKSFFGPFPLNFFTTIYIYNIYPLHALIYGLKFIFEYINVNFFKKIVFLIKMTPFKINSLNFGNSQLYYSYSINFLIKT